VTTWCALVLGIGLVRSGRLDGVLLATLVLTPLAAFEAVAAFPAAAQQLRRSAPSAERVLAVLRLPPSSPDPVVPLPAPTGAVDLLLDRVTVRWPGQSAPALDEVTLHVPAGRRVALVGPSGAGKSTVAAAAAALVPVAAGAVRLADVPIARMRGDDVRSVVGLCAQDEHVFDATVEENVRIGRVDATVDQVRAALAAARLLEWVDAQPDGLATRVGERGARLSGGERRRLVLARCLLADRAVLVLDEPTEHLDDDTALPLLRDLLDATRGRTTLLVTHRLDQLEELDEVVVLVAGRVAQRGTHAQLVAEPGWYREAFSAAGT